jgi:hypothetical protein
MPLPDELLGNRETLTFGAGINVAASPIDIHISECGRGSKNFALSIDSKLFRRRAPFDLVATATNGEQINGYAQLAKADGTYSTLIQAGNTVYEWDGSATGFTVVGSVNSGARIRGPRQANWVLTDEVLITDLALQHPVSTWDGTTFATMTTGLANDFFAKYCLVERERAFFGNVKAGTATPHMIAVSKLSDNTVMSVTDRPSTGLAVDDPFYLLTPDFRPDNGVLTAFGIIVFSSEKGRMYKLTGTNAQDYAIDELYPDSAAAGEESMAFIGNDVAYGREGKIETLFATETSGDVATDDLSRLIRPLIEDVLEWTVVYNARFQHVYFFPKDNNVCLVLHKSFVDEVTRAVRQRREVLTISPWSVWDTKLDIAFQPTCTWTMTRPTDGLETSYMGWRNGEIYELEGVGSQDGGTADIECIRVSKTFKAPKDTSAFDIYSYLYFEKLFVTDIEVTFEMSGENLISDSVEISLPASANAPVWGGGAYWGGGSYYGASFQQRYSRKRINSPGSAPQYNIRLKADGAEDFILQSVETEFRSTD